MSSSRVVALAIEQAFKRAVDRAIWQVVAQTIYEAFDKAFDKALEEVVDRAAEQVTSLQNIKNVSADVSAFIENKTNIKDPAEIIMVNINDKQALKFKCPLCEKPKYGKNKENVGKGFIKISVNGNTFSTTNVKRHLKDVHPYCFKNVCINNTKIM